MTTMRVDKAAVRQAPSASLVDRALSPAELKLGIAEALKAGASPTTDRVLAQHAPHVLEMRTADPANYRALVASLVAWLEAQNDGAEIAARRLPAAKAPARSAHVVELAGDRVDLASHRTSADERAAFKEWKIEQDSAFSSGRNEGPWRARVAAADQTRAKDPALASVPDEDFIALVEYTSSDRSMGASYAKLNPALREGDQSSLDRHAQVLRHAVSALQHMPAMTGEVFRAVNLSPEDLERYAPGKTIMEPSFTSTSLSEAAVEPFASDTDHQPSVLFVIDAKGYGRDISALSRYENEREVLFGPGQRFEVTGREQDARGRAVVKLSATS